MPSLLRYMVNI